MKDYLNINEGTFWGLLIMLIILLSAGGIYFHMIQRGGC